MELNTSNLDDDEDLLLEFSIMWERLEVYKDIDEWWENYAKPESRALCSVHRISWIRSEVLIQGESRV